MHPTLKLIGWTIAPLVFSLPITVVMSDHNQGAALAVSAKQHAQESISEKKAESDRLLEQGIQQLESGHQQAAIRSLEQALVLYRQTLDLNGEALAFANLGVVYSSLSNREQSVNYLKQALPIFRQVQNRNGEAFTLNKLGEEYNVLSKYGEAIKYYQEALLILRNLQDKKREVRTLTNLGWLYYSSLSKYDRAIEYYQEALPIYRQLKNYKMEIEVLRLLSIAHRELSQFDKEIEYLQQRLIIAREHKELEIEIDTLGSLGHIYSGLEKFEKAIEYYHQLLEASSQNERGKIIALGGLTTAYVQLNDFKEALKYHEKEVMLSQQERRKSGSLYYTVGQKDLENTLKLVRLNFQAQQFKEGIKAAQNLLVLSKRVGTQDALIFEREALLFLFLFCQNLGDESRLSEREKEANEFYKDAFFYTQESLEVIQELNINDESKSQAKLRSIGNLGRLSHKLKNYSKAIDYYLKSLQLSQQIDDQKEQRDLLREMGITYLARGDSDRAIECHKQALSLARKSGDVEEEMTALAQLGNTYSVTGAYHEALAYYQENLALARKIDLESGSQTNESKQPTPNTISDQLMKDLPREIQALNQLAKTYSSIKEYAKAIDYYQASLSVSDKINRFDAKIITSIQLAKVYLLRKDYLKGSEILQNIESFIVSISPSKDDAQFNDAEYHDGNYYSVSLNADINFELGEINYSKGDYRLALNYYRKSMNSAYKADSEFSTRKALKGIKKAYLILKDNNSLADVIREEKIWFATKILVTGRQFIEDFDFDGQSYSHNFPVKAIDSFQEAVIHYRKCNLPEGEALALLLLGRAYYMTGSYAQAIEYYKQSLSIGNKINSFRIRFNALVHLGDVYLALNNYPLARYYFTQSYEFGDKIFKEKSQFLEGDSQVNHSYISYNYTIGNLKRINKKILLNSGSLLSISYGDSYLLEGNYSEAIDIYQSSLNSYRSINSQEESPFLLMRISRAYLLAGNYNQSLSYAQRAWGWNEKKPSGRNSRIILSDIGNIYDAMKSYDKAVQYQLESLSAQDASGVPFIDPDMEGNLLSRLGRAVFHAGDLVSAEKILRDSLDSNEEVRDKLGREHSLKVSIFEKQISTYQLLQKVIIVQNRPNDALEITERGRARTLVELLANRLAISSQSAAISQHPNLRQRKSSIDNRGQSIIKPPTLDQIKQIAKQQNATLIQYSFDQEEFETPDKKQLRGFKLYIWVISPKGEIDFRQVDITRLTDHIDQLISISRDAIGVRGRSEEADILISLSPEKQRELQEKRDRSLRQLHQLLIEPIADLLPKNENDHVIFMPQGELFLVPFPALLNAQNQPLIAQHTILTAPSIQTLDLTHKTALSHPKGNRPALVVGNPTMPAVTTVIGDPPKKLSALPGSETEAKAIAAKLNTQPILGADAKKDVIVQKMQNAGIIHFATHGLLDSFKGDTPGAIALAPNGTNQPNDGLLTSGEIFDLKLNADLVVLSACDTGRGDITGDGVIGLSRSLFVAGVPSVIVSLWKVPDDSTALLMSEFYKNWKDRKLDKAQALRQAMLTTMKTNPNPKDWAAFTLIGEAD